MSAKATRRRFLKATAGSAALGLGDFSFLSNLGAVSADDAKLEPEMVQFRPEIEPLVRLLEDTPRSELLERVAEKIRKGTSYRELLTSLLLAGVRNVQPRPSVGFKFHAVLVVNSAHLASLSSPDTDRWLPIFWAIDYFKSSQARDVQEGNWTMAPVDEASVPASTRARGAFVDAMDRWDEAAADAAVAGLARTAGANALFEVFARYGARDFRSIGHKAIFVANSWRTLNCIGWQHSEPVLRSLAYALLNHGDGPNPAESDLEPDRPWRRNQELARKIPENWQTGERSDSATTDLLATLRDGSPDDACDHVVELLNNGIAPQSIYDGLYVGAGELLMRQPGIVGLHAVTTTNALRYAYATSATDESRRMLMLQNAAFLPMFRSAMKDRGNVRDTRIDTLEPIQPEGEGAEAVADIFRDVGGDRDNAAAKILAYMNGNQQAKELIDTARRLIFLKGRDSHDYKFSSAALEDYLNVSPSWRDRYLATSVFNLKGSGDRDNPLTARTRAALGT